MAKGVFVKGMEKPEDCLSCPFLSKLEEITNVETDNDNNICYHKIGHCWFSPPEVEDPWRGERWLMRNTEDWCPIKEIDDKEE